MEHSDAVTIAKQQRAENIRHEIVLALLENYALPDVLSDVAEDTITTARKLAAFVIEG
jgi:hypothetical protein